MAVQHGKIIIHEAQTYMYMRLTQHTESYAILQRQTKNVLKRFLNSHVFGVLKHSFSPTFYVFFLHFTHSLQHGVIQA